MTRLKILPLVLLLVPATARANGLGALAAFIGLLLLGAAIVTTVYIGLVIASALIGRKSAPKRAWKRVYAWIVIVVTILCGLFMLPLAVLAIILLLEGPSTADMIIFVGVILGTVLGGVSLWLAIRILRRNKR